MPSIHRQPLSPADLAITQRTNSNQRFASTERTNLLSEPVDAFDLHFLSGLAGGASVPGLALTVLKLSPIAQSLTPRAMAYAAGVLAGTLPVPAVAGCLIGLSVSNVIPETRISRSYAALTGGSQAATPSVAKVTILSAALGAGVTAINGLLYWLHYAEDAKLMIPPTEMAVASLLPIGALYTYVSRRSNRQAEQRAHARLNQPPSIMLHDLAAEERFYAV